jgi:hypothetical protein
MSLLGLVGGCASDRPQQVPADAMLKTQGNDRLVYTADQPGNVWVADKGSNKIVYSGRLNSGDRLAMDTKHNLLTVNDRAVITQELPRRDYNVFFEPGLAVPASSVITDEDAIKSELKRPKTVPASANLVGEGRDRVEYAAADDGDVWIVNADRNELVYSGRVLAGEHVMVDPKHDELVVGTHSGLADRRSLPDDNYRIFFTRTIDRPAAVLPATPPELPARTTVVTPERTTVITPSRTTVVTPAPVVPPSRPGASESPAVAPPDPRASIRAGETPVAVVERPGTIPAGAITWSDSKDRTNLTATDAGTAWVVDDSNRIVYTSRLVKGDTLAIDPANDQILFNGSRAYDGRLTAGRYRVYFDKTR